MSETLKAEQAYFKAIGIETELYDDGASESLVSTKTKQGMFPVVWSATQSLNLMLGHEIHVEFYPSEVWAHSPDGTVTHCVRYGDAQWKSKQWAFGMAVVQAVTDKLERAKL